MDRDAEAQAVNELQDKIADRHVGELQDVLTEAMVRVAAGIPTGGRPDPPDTFFPALQRTMASIYREITRETAASMVDRFKSGFSWLETKADEDGFYERLYEEYMSRHGGQRIAQISEATRRQIVRIIERGLKDGLSLDEIGGELMQTAPILSETRAHIISRTETHSASMFASLQSAKRSTIPLNKEWVAVEDHRTRDFGEGDGEVDLFSHRTMDGVRVPMDDPFEVPTRFGTTEQLMYPGDPAGSAANVINCRCAQVYVTVEDETEDTPPPPPARPRDRFRYETIEDPKASPQAIADFLIDNGIAARADLKGVTAKEIAPLMRYMLEVHERFGLDPVMAVGPASRFTSRARRIKANAAIYPTFRDEQGRRGIWHMPTSFGQRKRYETQQRYAEEWRRDGKYLRKRQAVIEQSTFIDDEVRARGQRAIQEGVRFDFTLNAPDEPDLHRRKIIYHEYGHVVHLTNTANPQMSEDINAVLRQIGHPGSGWGYLLSDYANSNEYELVAESFSLYMSGPPDQYWRIHPELLAVFRRYDRAAGQSSYILMPPPKPAPRDRKNELGPEYDAAALIREIVAHPERREELVAAYKGGDLEAIEPYIDEALALFIDPT